MIEASIRAVGAARSGVIDENGVILAGNGTYEALARVGIEKVNIVDAEQDEWVVVQRAGLTEEQKRTLSVSDNRAGELATWDYQSLQDQGVPLHEWFDPKELAKLAVAPMTLTPPAPPLGTEPDLAPTSTVRMAQLFFDEATHPEFLELIGVLQSRVGADSLTSTVLAALRHVCAQVGV